MVIDLTPLIPGIAIGFAALLLVVWLLFSRTLRGFVTCIAGWIIIYAGLHSDGKPETLIGIAVVGFLLTFLLMALWSILAARSKAARSRGPRYVPTSQRK